MCVMLLNSLQSIPVQLQGLRPTHEGIRAWFGLSRLALHLRRASASTLSADTDEGAVKDAEIATLKQKKETRNMKTGMNNIRHEIIL